MSDDAMTKDEWIQLFRAAGMDDEGMSRWHREFESRHPEKHQAFLGWLQIPEADIERIRMHSRS